MADTVVVGEPSIPRPGTSASTAHRYAGFNDAPHGEDLAVNSSACAEPAGLALHVLPVMCKAGEPSPSSLSPLPATLARERVVLLAALDSLQASIDEAYLAISVARGGYRVDQMSPGARNAISGLELSIESANMVLREGHDLVETVDQPGQAIRQGIAMLSGVNRLKGRAQRGSIPTLRILTSVEDDAFGSLGILGSWGDRVATLTGAASAHASARASECIVDTGQSPVLSRSPVEFALSATASTDVAAAVAPAWVAPVVRNTTGVKGDASALHASAWQRPTTLCLDEGDRTAVGRCDRAISDHLRRTPSGVWSHHVRPASLRTVVEGLWQVQQAVGLRLLSFRQTMGGYSDSAGCEGTAVVALFNSKLSAQHSTGWTSAPWSLDEPEHGHC